MFGSLQALVARLRRALLGRLVCVAEERGAATAEYTLVTLVAATIAFLLLNWAKGGALTDSGTQLNWRSKFTGSKLVAGPGSAPPAGAKSLFRLLRLRLWPGRRGRR